MPGLNLETLLIWVGLSAVVGWAASRKNRSGPAWFGLALFVSPLIAGIAILVVSAPAGTGYAQRAADLDAMLATGAISDAEHAHHVANLRGTVTGRHEIYACGRCGKPLSWGWKRCEHCKASFSEFPPVATGRTV